MASHVASPLSQSSAVSPQISAASTPSTSPSQARRGDTWGSIPKRLPSTLSPETSVKRGSPVLARNIPNSGATGADGGSSAIGERRRESNSFKTLTTGSLVSNSPWTKSLGRAASPVQPIPGRLGGGTSGLRGGALAGKGLGRNSGLAELTRKVSGGRKDESLPLEIKENMGGAVRIASGEGEHGKNVVRLSSPSTPFRPVRQASPTVSTSTFAPHAVPGLFKPSRTPGRDSRPRQSSAYAAAQSIKPVSSSPFIARLGSTFVSPTLSASPPLQQLPDDTVADDSSPTISSTQENSSPSITAVASPSLDDLSKGPKSAEGVGLGIRPGGPTPLERRIAGTSAPPPSTPPQENERTPTSSTSPASAIANIRRGMTGPRPLSIVDHFEEFDSLDIDELEGGGPTLLKRKSSSKTVTWATTEEVLEFDAEEERRVSGASQLSETSSSTSTDDSTEGEEESEESINWQLDDPNMVDGDGSLGFDEESASFLLEEGGSVIERAVEDSFEAAPQHLAPLHQVDDDAVDSAVSSTVEEMMGQIDAFIAGDVFSPSLVTDDHYGEQARQLAIDREKELSNFAESLRAAPSPFSSPQPGENPLRLRSAFSVSSSGAISDEDDDDELEVSETSFDAGEEEIATLPASSPHLSPAALDVPEVGNYSLPDLPDNSPFIGFEDIGAAESVVTLDFEGTPSTAPRDLDATPTKATPQVHLHHAPSTLPPFFNFASESLLTGRPPLQHLSRQASLVNPDPEPATAASSVASSLDSLRGSLRGGRLRKGKEQFLENQERFLRTHEFQSPPLPSTMEEGPPVAILARPAVKASSATLSSSMLPAIEHNRSTMDRLMVGTVLTAEVAQGMESPLDRLQRGVAGDGYSNRNSVVEVEDAEDEEVCELEDEVEEIPVKVLKGGRASAAVSRGRETARTSLSRRRSLSTGDVSNSHSTSNRESLLSEPLSDFSFGPPLAASFGEVVKPSKRTSTYRVREHGTIYADDGSSNRASFAIDDGLGKAWRKKRPSNVNNRLSVPDLKALKESRDGQLFAKIVSANFPNLPVPSKPTLVEMSLANRQMACKAGTFTLGKEMVIKKEFELSSGPLLTFQVILTIPVDSRNRHLLPTVTPVDASPPMPSSPTKSSKSPSRLRSVFSSPKKNQAPPPPPPITRPPVPERILSFLDGNGVLAVAKIDFKQFAPECRLKTTRITIPFESPSEAGSSRAFMSVQGSLTLDLFHVPSIPGFTTKADKERLPKSAEEARAGMELASSLRVTQQGTLTQLGGDCSTWKRRLFKLRGTSLLPYSEITKQARVEVDLSLVTSIIDMALFSTGQQALDGDEPLWTQPNMFRLMFADGSDISLFADSPLDKDAWIEALTGVAGKAGKSPPEWAKTLYTL